MLTLVHLVGYVMYTLGFAIVARSILTWFPIDRSGPVFQAIAAITDPVLDPLRRVIPPIGVVDLTPLIATLPLLYIGQALIAQ